MIADPSSLYGPIMFFSMDVYSHIQAMSFDEIMAISKVADQALLEHPLECDKNGKFPMFDLPTYDEQKSLVYCLAYVSAVLVWTQKHLADNELPASPFLDAAYMGYKLWHARSKASNLDSPTSSLEAGKASGSSRRASSSAPKSRKPKSKPTKSRTPRKKT